MTTTITPPGQIDARSTLEKLLRANTAPDEFSEAEMNMIDIAAVHVYKKARGILPSELIDFAREGDPAGAIRQWAYQWAHEHPREVHERTGGQIVHHVRRRLRQELDRYLKDRLKDLPIGFNLEAAARGLEAIDEEKREKRQDNERGTFTTTRPVKRPQPLKYRQTASPLEKPLKLAELDRFGRFIPEDQQQFMVEGRRAGAPVWETREALEKLHTRRPSRAEYWGGVLDGNAQRTARRDLAADTELHENTVNAIAEDVCPAVSERFSTGTRPKDYADVQRIRLKITSEEVRRVLLERFDVLYED